jgi:hypothetical protein
MMIMMMIFIIISIISSDERPCNGSVHVGFVVDKMAAGQVSFRVLQFPLSVSFHPDSPCSYITWGMKNRLVGGHGSDTSSNSIDMNNNKYHQMYLNLYHWCTYIGNSFTTARAGRVQGGQKTITKGISYNNCMGIYSRCNADLPLLNEGCCALRLQQDMQLPTSSKQIPQILICIVARIPQI